MIAIKDKDNNIRRGYINATDIQLLDIEDKFKHKNLEDALKEVGSGTEQNMLRIEDKVDKLEEDKTNILKTIGNVNVETDGNVASQLKDCAKNISQLSNPNLLINGDFQVWQWGENQLVSSALTAYCADRWRVHQTNILQSKQLTNDNRLSKYCLRVENKGDTASQLYLTQPFEHDTIDYLTDKTLTLSFWIKGYNGAENTLYYEIGNKQIGSFTLTNDWQKITGTVKAQFVKDNINLRGVTIFTSSSNLIVKDTGFYITDVKLELDSVATPFVPRSYGEELALCQRYYEKSSNFVSLFSPINGSLIGFDFKVEKRITPTVIFSKINDEAHLFQPWAGNEGYGDEAGRYEATTKNLKFIDTLGDNILKDNYYITTWTANAEIF